MWIIIDLQFFGIKTDFSSLRGRLNQVLIVGWGGNHLLRVCGERLDFGWWCGPVLDVIAWATTGYVHREVFEVLEYLGVDRITVGVRKSGLK